MVQMIQYYTSVFQYHQQTLEISAMVGPGEESKVAIVCWSLLQFAKVCHILLEQTLQANGSLYSLDWTTGLDYWTGFTQQCGLPEQRRC